MAADEMAYEMGVFLADQGDYAKALRVLAGAGDDHRALLALGRMASNGQGRPEDPAEAARLYERAAGLGSGEAAYNLGALYGQGRGVRHDADRALEWYERAGDLGYAPGWRMAGMMYAAGDGRATDLTTAERFWRKAAAAGDAQAMADLGQLHAYYLHEPVAAADWYLRAYGGGQEEATSHLLRLAEPLRRAFDGGDARAGTMLGAILALFAEDGQEQAVGFLTEAAQAGDAEARRILDLVLAQRN
ncbi:tetratricopeptide repeat protein [Hamadaea tsunoensis]|uniref:tetratricopeptide repeat protein n=1 Tax=Hamadaea tsunoensis TaxID=53368 RepID=UPI00040E1DA9|nr:tetratricopeptide repeat protein [Hamadaea tsunoensis]